MSARRRFWGWGNEGEGPSDEQAHGIAKTLAARFETEIELAPEPRIEEIALPAPRVTPPAAVAASARPSTTSRVSPPAVRVRTR